MALNIKSKKKSDVRTSEYMQQNKNESNVSASNCTKISDIVVAAAAATSFITSMAVVEAMNHPEMKKQQKQQKQQKEEIVLSCDKLLKTNISQSIAASDMSKQISPAAFVYNNRVKNVKDQPGTKPSRRYSDFDFLKNDSSKNMNPANLCQTKTRPMNETVKNQVMNQSGEKPKKDMITKINSCQIHEEDMKKYVKQIRSASDFGIPPKKDVLISRSFGMTKESSTTKIGSKENVALSDLKSQEGHVLEKNSIATEKDSELQKFSNKSVEKVMIPKPSPITRKGSIFVDANVETNYTSEESRTTTSFAGCQRLEFFEDNDFSDTEAAADEEEDILADETIITVKRPPSHSLPIIHPVSEVYKVGVYRKSFDSAAASILNRSNADQKLMRSTATSTTSVCSTQTSCNKGMFLESRPPQNTLFNPFGSPRSNRRRIPFRESRRISIEQSGSFIQLSQFKQSEQIGQGSYGLVQLAFDSDRSMEYAMKILSKRRLLRKAGILGRGSKKTFSPLDRVYNEIAVLKKLDHPNVVKLIEVLGDPLEDSLYMIFEYVKQGGVLNIPADKPLTEERAWSVFRDAVKGLEYMHHQRIIHADIKPSNLLVTESGHVKIGDLGLCSEFFGDELPLIDSESRISGTAFRAPETLFQGQQFLVLGKASDIWSLGATLYALIFGYAPFMSSTVAALYDKVKNESLVFPETPLIGSELRDLIKRMLTKDPAKRITLPKIKEHPWVTSRWVYPLPSEEDNCNLVHVSEENLTSAVRCVSRLDTYILIKTTLKGELSASSSSVSGKAPQRGGSRLERFTRAGRSNSAPGAYPLILDMQLPNESTLPSLMEYGYASSNEGKEGN